MNALKITIFKFLFFCSQEFKRDVFAYMRIKMTFIKNIFIPTVIHRVRSFKQFKLKNDVKEKETDTK